MLILFISIIETLLLVTALSFDAFITSLAYGANKIKIPLFSSFIITIISTLMLTFSLYIGTLIEPLLPFNITKILGFIILFTLGAIKIFDGSIKKMINRYSNFSKQIKFSFYNLNFILNIYANPQIADKDKSRILSSLEAVGLALALSFDGVGAGIGAALISINILEVIILSLIMGILSILLGGIIGNKLANKIPLNLSFLSGFILIIFALSRLF